MQRIKEIISNNDIVLFMKGNEKFPQCGFSNTVVQILKNFDLKCNYIDVLRDNDIRESVKEYSDWPTIPQLYIKKEFIGGCDIIREMYEEGTLKELLQIKGII